MFDQRLIQSGDPTQSPRMPMTVVRVLVRCMALCASIWLRIRFGSEYTSVRLGQLFRLVFLTGGFGILFLLLVMGGVSSNGDPALLIVFLLASVARYISHRIAGFIRRKRGTQDVREDERQFSGVPLLGRLLPFFSETFIKRYVEPLFVLVVGYAVSHGEPVLGGWLMVSGVCLYFDEQLEKTQQDRIERQWREVMSWQTQMNGDQPRPRAAVAAREKRSELTTPVPMPDAYAALSPVMRAWLERERQPASDKEAELSLTTEEHPLTYESDLV